MKKINHFLGWAMFMLVCLAGPLSVKSDALTYHIYPDNSASKKAIGEIDVTYSQVSDSQTELIRIKTKDDYVMDDRFVLDRDYAVEKWTRINKVQDIDIYAEKQGNVFVLKGRSKGQDFDKEIKLGAKPLFIYPEYSLGKFALSGMKKYKFWTLRRDKMSKLPMKAINKGVTTIVVNGKEIEAVKVYYAIDHKLKEKYYNHNYYYRTSDGLLVKREVSEGRIEELIKE